MKEIVLKLENVWYAYSDTQQALNGVSLHVTAGEWIGVSGSSKAGKSTLGRLCAGLLRPQQGAVSGSAAGQVAWVPQDPHDALLGGSVIDEVAFGPANQGLQGAPLQQRVSESLQAVGLPKRLWSQNSYRLSGGEKQRVAVAAALALHTRLVVLDEPGAMLDLAARTQLLSAVKRISCQQRVAILYITHNLEELVEADRLIFMSEGTISVDGKLPDILLQPDIQSVLDEDIPALALLAIELQQRQINVEPKALTAPALAAALGSCRP